jgi:hypothetical protein
MINVKCWFVNHSCVIAILNEDFDFEFGFAAALKYFALDAKQLFPIFIYQ